MAVEPLPGEPAAVATTGVQRLLVIADYHAGIESVLRTEGVELTSRAERRRERLVGLVTETGVDRLVIVGDLVHAIGDPWDAERSEIETLFDTIQVPVTVVKGNHDGDIDSLLDELDHDITLAPPTGARIGELGFVHGHTWPERELLDAEILCMGHEHPVVRLEDSVGGHRLEQVWLRGALDGSGFRDNYESVGAVDGELIVFPAFNELSGGTWANVDGQEFLSPFLPAGLANGEAYLLDGTRLGSYQDV